MNNSSNSFSSNKKDADNKKAENENIQNANAGRGNKTVKARIYNLIIVDESGSMSYLREATIGGVNETINTIKSAQKKYADTQSHMLTLVTFDSGMQKNDVRTIIDNKPIMDVKKFSNYYPNGGTPLFDAIGQSVSRLYSQIKDDEDATGVVTILTDGMENSSREWKLKDVSSLIEQLKSEGWSFSYMGSAHDVKGVSMTLKIENVIEFSHDAEGSMNTWNRESASRNSYYEKMEKMYREKMHASKEEKIRMRRQYASEYYSNRVTPGRIRRLEANEVFVFGSNLNGHHSGGASKAAVEHFGAMEGQGEGLQGQSYAIPSTDGFDVLRAAVYRFVRFACDHPEKRFLVTAIGCGRAGFSIEQVAPLFRDCIKLENVALPAEFWKVLGLTNY